MAVAGHAPPLAPEEDEEEEIIEARDALEQIQLEPAVKDWSKDISKFADLNWKAHVNERGRAIVKSDPKFDSFYFGVFQDQSFQDGIEDLLIRIEEFDHLLSLTQSDASKCLFKQMPKIVAKYEEMEVVFDKIDKYVVRCRAEKGGHFYIRSLFSPPGSNSW